MPEKDGFSKFILFLSEVWEFLHLSNHSGVLSERDAPQMFDGGSLRRDVPKLPKRARRNATLALVFSFSLKNRRPCGRQDDAPSRRRGSDDHVPIHGSERQPARGRWGRGPCGGFLRARLSAFPRTIHPSPGAGLSIYIYYSIYTWTLGTYHILYILGLWEQSWRYAESFVSSTLVKQ